MMHRYTIDQIKSVMAVGFDYDLPSATMECIEQLIADLGVTPRTTAVFVSSSASTSASSTMKPRPTTSRGSTTTSSMKSRSHPQQKNHCDNNTSWKSEKQVFQPTVFEETTNKLDKITETLRLLLNKLSDKTYEKIKSDVCHVLDENTSVISEQYAIEISKIIFDLASSNRFYSQSFAELYAHLIEQYHYMQSTLDINIQSFVGLFDEIVCVDANTNYELYCECNKVNERRRALAAFFVNLMKIGVIPNRQIVQFLCKLLRKFHEYILIVDKKNETNEICEVVSILFDNTYNYANTTEEDFLVHGQSVNVYMMSIAKSKVSNYKSLTSKCIFKFMDLLEM